MIYPGFSISEDRVNDKTHLHFYYHSAGTQKGKIYRIYAGTLILPNNVNVMVRFILKLGFTIYKSRYHVDDTEVSPP